MKSYISLFRNYANFSGFMKRGAYWTAMIIHWLILLFPLYPLVRFFADPSWNLPDFYIPWVLPIWCLYYLLMIIPVWSATVRRLHTLPRSGWWLLLGLIPVIGSFIIFIWLLQKGNYEDFVKRVKKSGAGTVEEMIRYAEMPHNGGWFFVFLVLLCAGGWFLNRQVSKEVSAETLKQAVRTLNEEGLSAVSGFEIPGWGIVTAPTGTPVPAPAEDPAEMPVAVSIEPSPTAADMEPSPTTAVIEPSPTAVKVEPTPTAVEVEPSPTAVSIEPTPTKIVAVMSPIVITLEPTEEEIAETSGDQGSAAQEVTSEPENAGDNAAETENDNTDPAETAEPAIVPETGSENTQGAPMKSSHGSLLLLPAENDVYASVYAVTVGQYAACVSDGACEASETVNTLAYPNMGDEAENLPMVYVTKDQAADFCQWAGMRLPTAEEWRNAAQLPEGAVLRSSNVNSVETNRRSYVKNENQAALTVPVTAFRSAASVYHMVQMYGNTWEWVSSSDDEGFDLALGGAWNSFLGSIGPEAELETWSGYAADNIGFRCFVDWNAMTEDLFTETDADELLDPNIRAKDNAQMVSIPPSEFMMGAANGAVDEKPVHEVSLSAYRIDAYEVTNAQYALCVADGVCTWPHESKSFRRPSYYGNPEYDNYPVIYVDWDQAETYCEWAEGRLPTEAEWEFAAKGPDGNTYPWGNKFISSNLVYSGNGDYDTVAVDATPNDVSSFGVYNLGGNVTEWVYDRYQENWYTVTNQPVDPTGPEFGNYHVIRGSGAQTAENNARTVDRFYGINTSYAIDRGFRCVMPGE